MRSNCKVILESAIPNKWDAMGVLFGREGVGKTTLGVQICKELDPSFCIERIVFTPRQFEEACENALPEQAILWDEAITGANASQHASGVSQSIISRLTQIRKKKLKIMLCFPYLHMLNKYFISRCLFSIYLYAKDFDDRGHGFFYSGNKTEYLFNLMKERYRINPRKALNVASKNFYFRFPGTFYVDEKEYDDKKETARKSDDAKTKDIWKERFVDTMKYIRDETNISMKKACEGIGIKYQNVIQVTR